MIKYYKTNLENNNLEEIGKIETGCWIDVIKPSEEEVEKLSKQLDVSSTFFKQALDLDEQPRLDIEDENKMFIVDVPILYAQNHFTSVRTIPLCILWVRDIYFVTISLEKNDVLTDFKEGKVKDFYTHKKSRFIIQLLYRIASSYLKYLTMIQKTMEQAEEAMLQATKNKELVQLLGLEKSLVYITTALKSNAIVLEKILKGNVIDLYIEDQDLLEDAIIENQQGIEMANLYRDILSSMTDTFATIISNNLNVIMKFLAGITIVLSIPTMVASFMGMNVPLGPFTDNPMSFLLLILIAILCSLVVAYILKRKNML